MTLIELLLAASMMAMLAGALGAMARAVQLGSQYSEGTGLATQHARITLEILSRAVSEASSSEHCPGAFVVTRQLGVRRLPETLVVWKAAGTVGWDRRPLLSELTLYTPDSSDPRRLLRISAPLNSQLADLSNEATLRTQVASIKSAANRKEVLLTDLLRTVTLSGSTVAAVRFEMLQSPSAGEWASYVAGTTSWNNLPWPQNVHGSLTGLRQTQIRTELQLMPGPSVQQSDSAGVQAIPFVGSASVYYDQPRIAGN